MPLSATLASASAFRRVRAGCCAISVQCTVYDESASLTALVTAALALAAVGTGFSGAPVVALLFCGASAVLRLWNQSQSVN